MYLYRAGFRPIFCGFGGDDVGRFLLRRRFLEVGIVIFCLGLCMISLIHYYYDKNQNDVEAFSKVQEVLNRYDDSKLGLEKSIEGLSRSAYVFDTVMSKEDYISRFLDSVLKVDDVIEMSRVVVDGKVIGDNVPDEVAKWYGDVADEPKKMWSDVYTYGDSTLRELYFPVFYNQEVVGFVSYSVNVDKMFVDMNDLEYSYVVGGLKLYETGRFDSHSEFLDYGQVTRGKAKIEYVYEDVRIIDVIRDSINYYVIFGFVWIIVIVLFGVSLRRMSKRGEAFIHEVSSVLSGTREGEYRKDFFGSSYTEVEYEILKSLRDFVEDYEKDLDLVEKLNISENRLSDTRYSNRKLRELYIKTKRDMVNEVSKCEELNDELIKLKEDYRLIEVERIDLKGNMDVILSDLLDTKEEVEKHKNSIDRVLKIANEFNVDDFQVDVCERDSVDQLDGLEYRLRLVLAELYSYGVSNIGMECNVDYMIEKLEYCVRDVGRVREQFRSMENELSVVIEQVNEIGGTVRNLIVDIENECSVE